MRVNSINTYQVANTQKQIRKMSNYENKMMKTNNEKIENNITFKSSMGKITGGLLGAAGAGLALLSVVATGGLAAAAALVAAEAGGAVIGGEIGDAITGDDED